MFFRDRSVIWGHTYRPHTSNLQLLCTAVQTSSLLQNVHYHTYIQEVQHNQAERLPFSGTDLRKGKDTALSSLDSSGVCTGDHDAFLMRNH